MKILCPTVLMLLILGTCQFGMGQTAGRFKFEDPIQQELAKPTAYADERWETPDRPAFEGQTPQTNLSVKVREALTIEHAQEPQKIQMPSMHFVSNQELAPHIPSTEQLNPYFPNSGYTSEDYSDNGPAHFYTHPTSSWASESGWGAPETYLDGPRPSFAYFGSPGCDNWSCLCKPNDPNVFNCESGFFACKSNCGSSCGCAKPHWLSWRPIRACCNKAACHQCEPNSEKQTCGCSDE